MPVGYLLAHRTQDLINFISNSKFHEHWEFMSSFGYVMVLVNKYFKLEEEESKHVKTLLAVAL